MKKLIISMLALLCLALPALAEETLPQSVTSLCEAKYPATIIAKWDGWGNDTQGQFALILTDGEDNILCIAEKSEGEDAFAFTVENTNAVREGTQIPSLLMDTGGDMLYYAYTEGNEKTTYSAMKTGGEWQKVSLIHQDFSHSEYDLDTLISVRDGFLTYDKRKYDKLENPMDGSDLAQLTPLPVSPAFEENMKLSTFDIDSISPDGWLFPVVPGVCHGLLESGDTLLQYDVQSGCILMLVRKADGTKRLRITNGWDAYKNNFAIEETGPVPEDASMDVYHMWDDVLFLGNDLCYFNFMRTSNGKWRFATVQSSDSFGVLYDGVENWEESSPYRNDHVTYGVSPWNADITQLDLIALPRSYSEALSRLDTSSYMFVNNPNPADRLHLRSKPQKGAASLGKFYNRTPVYVMEIKGEWAHVRIGSKADGLEGYMMSQYLTRGDVACAFPQKHILSNAYGEIAVALTDRPEKNAQEIAVIGGGSWNIIGVANEHWYVIMTGDGIVGYALQGAFWDGNG